MTGGRQTSSGRRHSGPAIHTMPCRRRGIGQAICSPVRGRPMPARVRLVVTRISPECRELIDHQHGIVARWQAAECASDLQAFASLPRADRWQSLSRGAYATETGQPAREGTLWAAVLRCGPTAALSHFTAAELDGLTDRPPEAIHVAIPG